MITFRIIYGFIPVSILWVNWRNRLLPANVGGRAFWFIIPLCIIRPKFRHDEGLIQHELTHCKQFWRTGLIGHLWKYNRDPEYRLTAEIEAYRVQLNTYPTTAHAMLFASFIATRYNLDITQTDALRRLTQ